MRFSGTKPRSQSEGQPSLGHDILQHDAGAQGATQFPPATPLGLLLSRKPAFIKAKLRLS